jgi:hypothetical protein
MKRSAQSNANGDAPKKNKKNEQKFSAAELAAMSVGRKMAATKSNLTKKFSKQSKGGSFTLKVIMGKVACFDPSEKPTLKKARMTIMPCIADDFVLPNSLKNISVVDEEVPVPDWIKDRDGEEASRKTRKTIRIQVRPNDNSRQVYDVEWGKLRTPIKHLMMLHAADAARWAPHVATVRSLFGARKWQEAAKEASDAVNGAAPYDEARAAVADEETREAIDKEFGVDRLPEFYEVVLRNGMRTTLKLPKESCENVAELLDTGFSDEVILHDLELTAWCWGTKSFKENEPAPWPKRATINTFASKVEVFRLSATALYHVFEKLHEAAPAALAHPIVNTVWQDVFSAQQSGSLAAQTEHGDGDMAAFGNAAHVLRLTSDLEEYRLAKQRAGNVMSMERFVETTEESMLTMFDKAENTKRIALKLICSVLTYFPTDAETTMFDATKSFAFRWAFILRLFKEHLAELFPIESVEAWIKLAPTLLQDLRAYAIVTRFIDGAFQYEETRKHQKSFREPYTTNEQRTEEEQFMEKLYPKRIVLDCADQVRRNGVPVSGREAAWLFDNFKRQVPRAPYANNAFRLCVVNLNELNDSDFKSVVDAPPGKYEYYAVSADSVLSDAHRECFEKLRDEEAHATGEPLASALFSRDYRVGRNEEGQGEADFYTPHEAVREAGLSNVQLGEPTYVFAIDTTKQQVESGPMVQVGMCKLLGLEPNDPKNTVESICAEVAQQAAIIDANILPSLQRIMGAKNEDYDDDAFDDSAMLEAAATAEHEAAAAQE